MTGPLMGVIMTFVAILLITMNPNFPASSPVAFCDWRYPTPSESRLIAPLYWTKISTLTLSLLVTLMLLAEFVFHYMANFRPYSDLLQLFSITVELITTNFLAIAPWILLPHKNKV